MVDKVEENIHEMKIFKFCDVLSSVALLSVTNSGEQ